MFVPPRPTSSWALALVACLAVGCADGQVIINPPVGAEEPSAPEASPPTDPTQDEQAPETTTVASNANSGAGALGGEPTAPEAPDEDPAIVDELNSLSVVIPAENLPKYDRSEWKHWEDADKDCQNTRAEVLIAESYDSVTFTNEKGCTVATGEWFDPFTGLTFFSASDLDIDHMVPLKNAHLSGAHAWTKDQKRAFANDMNHPEHLIAVQASANRSKGARGPEEWKPPANDHWCEYASEWVQIKVRWQLSITPDEYDALSDMLNTC